MWICESLTHIQRCGCQQKGKEEIEQFKAKKITVETDVPKVLTPDGELMGITPMEVEALRQFKWPVYGWVIRRLGNIPIDRKNIHASMRSMKTIEQALKWGLSIVILPEGHRHWPETRVISNGSPFIWRNRRKSPSSRLGYRACTSSNEKAPGLSGPVLFRSSSVSLSIVIRFKPSQLKNCAFIFVPRFKTSLNNLEIIAFIQLIISS